MLRETGTLERLMGSSRPHTLCSCDNTDNAVDQCPTCLHACIHAKGGYFEHTLCGYQFVFSVLDELYVPDHA